MRVQRRDFLKSTALLGGSSTFAAVCGVFAEEAQARALPIDGDYEYHSNDPQNIIYSTCLQCHTACPIKCKLHRPNEKTAVLVKIDGNPYSAQARFPNIEYKTPPNGRGRLSGTDVQVSPADVEGRICPKGQAGMQTQYDPYRLRKVLKRAGKRGQNKWQTIPFDQAVEEISNGAKFADGTSHPGLAGMYVLTAEMTGPGGDPLAKEMAGDVALIRKKQMSVEQFKSKYRDHLHVLLDPDHPDLGPKNNQFVFLAGRIEHGRKELMKFFTQKSFGSINCFEHTTICEQSHHIAFEQATNAYKAGKWGKGQHHMKPDLENASFVIFFGTGVMEANFGPPLLSGLHAQGVVERGLRFVVVDPRLSRTAGKAEQWIPILPGGDVYLAMGMLRWMIDNGRYDQKFLRHANAPAAKAGGEVSYTTASYLVRVDKLEDGARFPGQYLRAKEAGLGDEHSFVVIGRDGEPQAVRMQDGSAVIGDLEPSDQQLAKVSAECGCQVKTAFQLLAERVREMSLARYAQLAGISEDLGGEGTIVKLAREFTSHGKRASAEFYRGAVQHTNGYYQAQAIILLNVLIGNSGWKGGWSVGGSHYHEFGGKDANVYDVGKLFGGRLTGWGVPCNRERAEFEESTLFDGHYDPKRPWYPFTNNLYQEVIPSADNGYPYKIGCLFLHKGTPVFSCPAGHKQISTLRDQTKIPLFIACDIVVGETSMYADYIIPDTAVWERWGTPHVTPALTVTTSKVRQPVVEPITEICEVFGEQMHICMEAFLFAVAEKLKLSGFGPSGWKDGGDMTRPEDWHLRAVANIALGDHVRDGRLIDAAPVADASEVELFVRSRRHLSQATYDFNRWKKAVGPAGKTKGGPTVPSDELWLRVISTLNRGGNFMDWDRRYKGNFQQHPYKANFNIYAEPVAMAKQSTTGKYFDGLPRLEPTKDARGNVVDDPGYEFFVSTFKDILGGHSRTRPPDPWLGELFSRGGNHVMISGRDAKRLGLREGDRVRVSSATLPDGKYALGNGQVVETIGEVQILEGIRPGVVSISWHYGHWAYGSNDVLIDGQLIRGDRQRRGGLNPNPLFREDTSVGLVCLTDPIGGSASFYDTRVRITKV